MDADDGEKSEEGWGESSMKLLNVKNLRYQAMIGVGGIGAGSFSR